MFCGDANRAARGDGKEEAAAAAGAGGAPVPPAAPANFAHLDIPTLARTPVSRADVEGKSSLRLLLNVRPRLMICVLRLPRRFARCGLRAQRVVDTGML